MPITEGELRSGEAFIVEGWPGIKYRLTEGHILYSRIQGCEYAYQGFLTIVDKDTAVFYISIFFKLEKILLPLSSLIMSQENITI